MIFPIYLAFKFQDFDFYSFRKALLRYEFEPKRTYFIQLFAVNGGGTLGAPIPFSIDKPFTLIKNNSGIVKPWGEIVKVEDVKVVEHDKVDGFDFISDLYSKITKILSYVGYRNYPYSNDKEVDFRVSILEDLPLNNIMFFNSSKKD